MTAPLLISLPHGLNASGVTAWALRLVNGLSALGRPCGLVVHGEPPAQRPLPLAIDPRVEVFDARCLPPLERCDGDLEPYMPVYRLAVGVLAARAGGGPVVVSPNLLGDSYGIAAELTRAAPGLVRVLCVHHSDIRYNDALCVHYSGMVSAFVGVSARITARLGSMLPTRAHDVYGIPYGVEVPASIAARRPLFGRPVRLLYTGRMDHEQKRIGALVVMSDELARRGIPHEIALLGDGPAAGEIDAQCALRRGIRRFPATDPLGVAAALDGADFFVLPSRYEGLSVSLLEALARGCVPLLTPSDSGTGQLVRDGETGFLAPAGPDAGGDRAGAALAGCLVRALALGDGGLEAIRRRGAGLVGDRFSAGLCARRYGTLLDRVAGSPVRVWPADRPAAFTGRGGGGSGTVPPQAAALLGGLLSSLAGRSIAVYGAGRHTLELREVFLRAPIRLGAFLDDDAGRHGATLWGVPIVGPERAADLGVTDIVISSWLHEDSMRAGCAPLERAGLRVHGLYCRATPTARPPSPPRAAPVSIPTA